MPYTPVDERESKSSGYKPVSDRLKAVASTATGVVKEVAKAPVRAAMIPIDLASNAINKKPIESPEIPGLGEVDSYSARALKYQQEPGYTPVTAGIRAVSEGVLDVASIASLIKSATYKPSVNEQIQNITKKPDSVKLFRGEGPTNKGGLHFTPDEEYAKNFGSNQIVGRLPKDSKLTTVTKEMVEEAMNHGAKNEKEAFQYIFDKGFDGVIGTDPMNPDKVNIIVNPKKISEVVGRGSLSLASFIGLSENEGELKDEDVPKSIPITRGNDKFRLREKDLDELAAVLYGEISNRKPDKQELESRIITGIALNRAKAKKKPLLDILQEDNQFQAYGAKQYKLFKEGKGDAKKVALVKKIIDEIRSGDLSHEDYKAFDAYYYEHKKDGSIKVDDKRPLFAKN